MRPRPEAAASKKHRDLEGSNHTLTTSCTTKEGETSSAGSYSCTHYLLTCPALVSRLVEDWMQPRVHPRCKLDRDPPLLTSLRDKAVP